MEGEWGEVIHHHNSKAMDLYGNIRFYMLLLLLCFLLPFFCIFKFFFQLYSYFSNGENVRGKVVLITGASSGIGEEMSYEYARRGASLVIVARREKQLMEVAKKARELGSPHVVPVCADVLNAHDCKRSVEEAIKHFGRLDHLVNNAGIGCVCSFEEVTDITKLAPVMDVNFWGSVYPTYYAIPHLKKTKGKIFVNASSSAYIPPPRLSVYAASKAALVSFYEVLRVELGPEISITTATLGFIDSEMTRGKHLSRQGTFEIDKKSSDDLINGLPRMSSKDCGKSMVDAICKKHKRVTEPKSYKVFFLLKNVCPELFDWAYRVCYLMTKSGPSINKVD